MSSTYETGSQKFSSPEEELAFVRQEALRAETLRLNNNEPIKTDTVVADAITNYRFNHPEEVLETNYALKEGEQEAIVLDLAPEPHDTQIEKLVGILQEKGLRNTLSIIEKMNDAHLADDFHRFLVQYIKAGFPVESLPRGDLARALHMTLYEITLPDTLPQDAEPELKKLISGMEQFYAGMLSMGNAGEYFSIEIANANGSDQFVFYAAVPDARKALFEKQILSIFHNAKVVECKDDYNIFNERGSLVGSYAISRDNPVLPLKLYEEFDVDPLNVVLNSFSKLDREGEGAAIQFIFTPVQDFYLTRYKEALRKLKEGIPAKKALDIPTSILGTVFKEVKDVFDAPPPKKKKEGEEEKTPTASVNESLIEEVTKKVSSPILAINIRILASAADEPSALEILSDIEASFNQFENTQGNALGFKRLKGGALKELAKEFSFRLYDDSKKIPLNVKELTTMMHFPSAPIKSSAQLKQAKAGTAPAPLEMERKGILLGVNKYRGTETPIYMNTEDRLRHFYVIGQTGTGKTTLLKNMIVQDMKNGEGLCFIDPHGSDVQDILAAVPEDRFEDVIYFDPSVTTRPMALNMLEYDKRFPEQKTFVVNEMLSIFDKLFDMKTAGGPMFEQYFRNAVMLTIEDPETGSTLLDVSRVLSNKAFRDMKLARCKNPIVTQFWREVAERAGGEASLQNIVPYIVSKFDNFLANDIMRPIVVQERSSFNFREVMDNRKILLVNLAKGRLGDINANLIGLILVGKILMAAFSRVDAIGKGALPPFYLYIDEFQNITTPSIATILSEARKYKLSLNIAHQFIGQLDDDIKNAVFGNVGSLAVFRVGTEDAEFLAKQFDPVFTEADLINLDNRNAYMKLLIAGRPVKPFNLETMPPSPGNPEQAEKLKELSYLSFGRPQEEVEKEVQAKYAAL